MSCVSGGNVSEYWARAKNQKLRYTGPGSTASKVARLVRLSKSDTVHDRSVAAGNPNTPLEALQTLVYDDSADVRGWLLRNPEVPKDILVQLTYDSEPQIAFVAVFCLPSSKVVGE
jgi:hypothetical protein